MLGVAIRIAQRIGIQSEASLAKYSVIEAEMRRRLWWSIVLFDHRISEITTSHITALDPTWDCRIPLNVNDSDLRPDMKEPPAIQGVSTEALFAVARSELGEYMRHTLAHINFTNPALKSMANKSQNGSTSEGDEMGQLESIIENRYLRFCDQENPLHYMTTWTMRTYIAKCHLFEHHIKHINSPVSQTDAERDSATSFALRMLEGDTNIMTSPLTKGFRWVNRLYFPFPAYLQIAQDLRLRPTSKQVSRAWEVLSDGYDAWFKLQDTDIGPIYQIYARIILQAWDACEAASKRLGVAPTPPRIVTSIRRTLSQGPRHVLDDNTDYPNSNMDIGVDDSSIPMPASFADQSLLYSNGIQGGFVPTQPEMYPQQAPLVGHLDQLDWTAFLGQPNWPGF
jgi:Fungal specific transcription factor domain